MDEERLAWDMYFHTLVGWSYHPGATRDGSARLSIFDAAKLADEMLVERRRRFQIMEVGSWDGEQ